MSTTRRWAMTTMALAVLAAFSIHFAAFGANNDHRVRAELSTSGLASGKAVYRERERNNGQIEQRFKVQVEDAEPGAMWQIHVNETMVGTIVIDDLGRGAMQFRTPTFIDDPGDGDPIPDGFPTLLDGDTITVGPLAGVFELD